MRYPQENVKPYNAEEKKSIQVERMFNHIAPTYDGLNHLLSLGIDKAWRRKAIRWLEQFHPRRIMDVATGTGDFAILACKMLHPDTLAATDISEGMMQIGKEKAQKAGFNKQISFKKEDCTSLTFPDGSFDAATVAFGIRNFEDLDKALSEIHRVLSPSGVLAILELSTPEHFPMKQLYRLYSRSVIPAVGKMFSKDNHAYHYLPDSIKAFPQGEHMQGIIQKAGFRNVAFKRLTFGICTFYMAKK